MAVAIPGTRLLGIGVWTAYARSADATATATGTAIMLLTATPARQSAREKSAASVHDATIHARPTAATPRGRRSNAATAIQRP